MTPAPEPRPERKAPSELELTEARIAETEARVEELERKLADDWTNMDVLAAHRAARDQLKELLGRWEELFDAGAIADSMTRWSGALATV